MIFSFTILGLKFDLEKTEPVKRIKTRQESKFVVALKPENELQVFTDNETFVTVKRKDLLLRLETLVLRESENSLLKFSDFKQVISYSTENIHILFSKFLDSNGRLVRLKVDEFLRKNVRIAKINSI